MAEERKITDMRLFEGNIIEQMTKGKYVAQSKGHWTSEDLETMGEAREGCMEEEALWGPEAQAGVG